MPIACSNDQITSITLSKVLLPLPYSVSDAKVLTGRQKPLQDVALLFAQIKTSQGLEGIGFSYSLRVGGEGQFYHACEIAPNIIGEDPNDISKIWNQLMWTGASVGRSGMAVQAIAAIDIALWDLKAKRAQLPLSKLIGAHWDSVPCYNTSGGYLQAPIEEILESAQHSLARGIGAVKMKVGQPDVAEDFKRVAFLRKHLGEEVSIMIDANQQWDRPTAMRFCRSMEQFNLVWIEEPLNAYDFEGHATLATSLDTPIATGEMLSSVFEHSALIEKRAADIIQPDAPRLGGITPFLRLADIADDAGLGMAPHFVMEIHIHLAACFPSNSWVEHFDWLEPLFNERLEICSGRMTVPDRSGLGLTLSEKMHECTLETVDFGNKD